jgi:D-beta-D-heptose 7-phosphate kinase/D-beta-D-heptose 1-phosphate adenosyltransferase
MNCLKEALEQIKPLKVLVVGDYMLDEYLSGPVERISREAPVPIVNIKTLTHRAGGAGNAALCFAALGAKVYCCGTVGNDSMGIAILKILKSKSCNIQHLSRRDKVDTIVKTRIIGENSRTHRQQLIRLDSEVLPLPLAELPSLHSFDFIALSDYNKGTISEQTVKILRKSKLPFTADPNRNRPERFYMGARLVTPNRTEAKFGKLAENEYDSMGKLLDVSSAFCAWEIIVTLDEDGCYAYNGTDGKHIPTKIQNICDVTGAGDVFFAVASMGVMSGLDVFIAAKLANIAAGLKVSRFGTSPITKAEILEVLNG